MATDHRGAGQQGIPVQPHHWRLVLTWSALAVICAWLTAYATQAARTSAWTPVVAWVIGGVIVTFMVSAITASPLLGAITVVWAATLAGWIAYARISGALWQAPATLALAGIAVVMTCWTLLAYASHHDAARRARAAEQRRAAREALVTWERLLEDLDVAGVKAERVDVTRAGRTVTYRLPESGKVTMSMLQGRREAIATARRLPPASVTFSPGRHAGEVIMHLNERDVFADDVPFPPATAAPLSINDPLGVGVWDDGSAAEILFREVAVMVIGVTGAGKSNLLNVLTAQFTRCQDTIVWMIDLKGGRLAAPWVRPWVQGQCDRPAIDWVATTREEAALMLDSLRAVIRARSASLAGGSKITPSRATPQYILIGDELPDIFGLRMTRAPGGPSNAQIAEIAGDITRQARSEAVMPVWTFQRATSETTGPTVLKSQCKLRFALAVTSEAEARSVIPDDVHAAALLASLVHPGTGLVWRPGRETPQPLKFWRLDPDLDRPHGRADLARIHELAAVAGMTRPCPDDAAIAVMGDAYTERWERSGLYRTIAGESFLDRRGGVAVAAPPAAMMFPGAPPPPPEPPRTTFDELIEAPELADLAALAPPPEGGSAARSRMYALLAEKRIWGLSVGEIGTQLRASGLGVDKSTIHKWLREDMAAGRIRKSDTSRGHPRYLLADEGTG